MNVKKKRPVFGRSMTVLAAVLLMMTGAWAAASDAYAQDDDMTLKGPGTDQDGYVTYDCIWFGNYKQGTDAEKSPIKWRVLKVDGDDVFLSADKVLDVRRYHDYEDERCLLYTSASGNRQRCSDIISQRVCRDREEDVHPYHTP